LDIYLPPNGKGPYPVIIWLHPGGFHAGDEAEFPAYEIGKT
jgi:carboxylesterase type B